jgi:hypothetical protein
MSMANGRVQGLRSGRMRGARSAALLIALCGLCGPCGSPIAALAQDVLFRASVEPEVVVAGEEAMYRLEVSASGQVQTGQPALARVQGVSIVSSGTSDNMQIVNGDVTLSRVFQYGLVATQPGTYTMPPARLDVGGRTLTSNSVVFKVQGGAPARPRPGAPQAGTAGEEPGAADPGGGDQDAAGTGGAHAPDPEAGRLFLRARVSRTRAYQGEPLVYSATLYTQYRVGRNLGIREEASFPGFLIEKQEVNHEPRMIVEQGQRYQSIDVSRKILVPTRSGKLSIRPELLQVPLVVQRAAPLDPWGDFGGFFGPQTTNRYVRAAAIDVDVLPLPADGRPADFAGAVGSGFVMSSLLDKTAMPANDVVTLKVTIRGHGDIRTVAEPKLDLGGDFKLYQTKPTTRLEATPDGLAGTKVFEYVLAPRGAGQKTIPGLAFTVFDTDRKAYRTLRTQAHAVTVQELDAADREPPVPVHPGHVPREVQVVRDIQYIKEPPGPLVSHVALVRRPAFLAANVAPVLIFLGLAAWQARRRRLEEDAGWARRSRAYSRVKRALAALAEESAGLSAREFHARLEAALLEYVAAKLSLPTAGLVVDQVREILAERGISAASAGQLARLLSRCEQMRYAPTGAEGAAMAAAGAAAPPDGDTPIQRTSDIESALSVSGDLEGSLS